MNKPENMNQVDLSQTLQQVNQKLELLHTQFNKTKRKIMKKIPTILFALLLSASLHANELILKDSKRFSGKYALLVFWDNAGLNNLKSNPQLGLKNIEMYKQLMSKPNLRKMRSTSITHFSFNEQVSLIGKIESSRTAKLYRESQAIVDEILVKLKEDNSDKAKDVINTFHFINQIVEQSYSDYTKVGIVVFSNLRDSMTEKAQRATMEKIKLNEKIELFIYANSGLDIKGASTAQQLQAEQSVIKFYRSKLVSNTPITIKTVY
ncbi:hypothetical protein [Sulfurimonas sp.]|uniref:hypothetical protein n=1 Tax=Sulfurimonas sp. TaxID=2022749 RepID=UPI003D1273B5